MAALYKLNADDEEVEVGRTFSGYLKHPVVPSMNKFDDKVTYFVV